MQTKKPMILVLAGPNGSGKSTITTFFEKVDTCTVMNDTLAWDIKRNRDTTTCLDIAPPKAKHFQWFFCAKFPGRNLYQPLDKAVYSAYNKPIVVKHMIQNV